MEVVRTIFPRVYICDLCGSNWFGFVDTLAFNLHQKKTHIHKFLKRIFPMEQRVGPVHLEVMAILASSPTSPATVPSVTNYAERDPAEKGRELPNAQMEGGTGYAVRLAKADTIPLQSVMLIRLISAMGSFVAVAPLCGFGERYCYIWMPWPIELTTRSRLRIIVTRFSKKPV